MPRAYNNLRRSCWIKAALQALGAQLRIQHMVHSILDRTPAEDMSADKQFLAVRSLTRDPRRRGYGRLDMLPQRQGHPGRLEEQHLTTLSVASDETRATKPLSSHVHWLVLQVCSGRRN